MFEITALPAKQGDALWIKWGDQDSPHQMFVDMGTEPIGKKIRARIANLDEGQRHFDLLVISHVDADHIGGVLTAIAEAEELNGFSFDEVWFNGFEHLNGKRVPPDPDLEPMGGPQGERLSHWLRGQVWNRRFDYAPILRDVDRAPTSLQLAAGLTVTILGPTKSRLENLIGKWSKEVEVALKKGRLDPDIVSPGLEPMGRQWGGPPVLDTEADLDELAETDSDHDDAEANGSSIVLLLEYGGRTMLLAGDAFSDDLVDAIQAVSPDQPLKLDLFKLPHHGSQANVHRELIDAVDCDAWLISTDGTQFYHPDPEAVARVIRYGAREGNRTPQVLFNQQSKYNECWGMNDCPARFGYEVQYGDDADGFTLRL